MQLMSAVAEILFFQTRMHSSRMHTVAITWGEGVCPGGCLLRRGVCLGDVSAWGMCLPRMCLPDGMGWGVSVQGVSGRHTPPPVDRMTDTCKTLPCRNYAADGNKTFG